MPILTYQDRSVFVDPVSYAEALQAAKNLFSLPPASAPASRVRFRIGWPPGAPVQDPARSVELAEGVWPVGLLPLNTQVWVELDEEHSHAPVALPASVASEPVTEPFVPSSQPQGSPQAQELQTVAGEIEPKALPTQLSHIPTLFPSPFLTVLDEADNSLLEKVSSRIEDAHGNLLFRVPLADEGSEFAFTVAEVLLNAARVLRERQTDLAIQSMGEFLTMENGEEHWDRSKGNVGRVLRTSDVVLVEVVCGQTTDGEQSDGCVEKHGRYKLDFPPTANIFDLRQRLTAKSGAFPSGRSFEIACLQDSSEETVAPAEVLHDLVRLHSLRQDDGDSPWIRLQAKEFSPADDGGTDSTKREEEVRLILSRMLLEAVDDEEKVAAEAYVPSYQPPRW
ncbi:hypothetical protein NBRC10512_002369 [Rhodotorula toruloides]|uniref:RHTO0S08e04654g1_1 n=2 Tax=Rhodotorula toruloides TaxID=5286 RepID=A0A061B2K9_RHOTO|nr:uncharacterized protein RHTO_01054 [Rhodotorula toruloides NP11]EMS22300.1 hypothetical protein RHTO_01054 [Rhodotorula toruloides NP11]CDR43701.1 RHTO0S08e04654g1_1 [Rhodotorula toruloides]